jgi:hypothetical protein
VHAYSLVGSDSCIGGSATLTAHFATQAVRAGVGASQGTPPAPRGTLSTTSSYARRTCSLVVQGAAVDTLPLCAAACDLRSECLAFSHTAGSTGGICTLHGTLHEGLVPQFNAFGEFTPDSHHNVTEQARPSQVSVSTSSTPSTSHSLVQLVLLVIAELCLQAIGENGNTVCMRKLVRRPPLAAAAAGVLV